MTHVYGEAALVATATLVVATALVPTSVAGDLATGGEVRGTLAHTGETRSDLD